MPSKEEQLDNVRDWVAEKVWEYGEDRSLMSADVAKEILSHPSICVLDEGQELPEIPFKKPQWAGIDMVQWELKEKGYSRCQKDMLSAGFKRVIKEVGK